MKLISVVVFFAILSFAGGVSIAADNQRSFARPSAHHANSHNLRDGHRGIHRTSRAARAFNKMRWRAKVIRHKGGLAPKRSGVAKRAFARHSTHNFMKGIRHHRVWSRKGLKDTARIWYHGIPYGHDTNLIEVGVPIDQATDQQDLGVASGPGSARSHVLAGIKGGAARRGQDTAHRKSLPRDEGLDLYHSLKPTSH